MKKTSTSAAIMAGSMITAGILLQGCQVYRPGERSLMGGRTSTASEPTEATVVTLAGEKASATGSSAATIAPSHAVPAGQVGTPGTYKEFVVGDGAKDPHAGLTKLSKKHVPAPPPAVRPTPAVSSAPSFTADGKYKLYRVKAGDTAGEIANSHGMKLADFLALNGIKTANAIRVGQQFKVPASGKAFAKGPSAPVADGATYTVVSGDSLSVIAKRHGMKTSELMALNGISDPNKVRVGQKLRIKGGAKVETSADKPADVKPVDVKPVEVKPAGEGEAPVEPVDGATGATSIDMLLKDAGATTTVPKTPEVATPPAPVPAPVPATPVVAPVATPVAAPAAGGGEHVVREGEDIYSIALRYKVRPVDIRSLNNLTSNALSPGQIVKIPPAAQ